VEAVCRSTYITTGPPLSRLGSRPKKFLSLATLDLRIRPLYDCNWQANELKLTVLLLRLRVCRCCAFQHLCTILMPNPETKRDPRPCQGAATKLRPRVVPLRAAPWMPMIGAGGKDLKEQKTHLIKAEILLKDGVYGYSHCVSLLCPQG
jgi:hypothetical protein